MDFNVNAGAGVLPGAAVALALRGPDPAITIPAHPHFFRRIAGLTLAPAVGALVPAPTTLPQSIIELVLGPAVSHNLAINVVDIQILTNGILPTKFEQALNQLEAEPPGVGLDPTANYTSLASAASAVLAAVARVCALNGALNAAYVLGGADFYLLEPVNAAAPANFIALTAGPSSLTLEHVSGPRGFLIHFGFFAFLAFRQKSGCLAGSPTSSFTPPLGATDAAVAGKQLPTCGCRDQCDGRLLFGMAPVNPAFFPRLSLLLYYDD